MQEAIRLYQKSTCSKCVRTVQLLHEIGCSYVDRDYATQPLTEDDIREIVGGGSVLDFINVERQAYADRGFDKSSPTEEQAIDAILSDNNLLLRPILIRGNNVVKGFQEDAIRVLAAKE